MRLKNTTHNWVPRTVLIQTCLLINKGLYPLEQIKKVFNWGDALFRVLTVILLQRNSVFWSHVTSHEGVVSHVTSHENV